MSHPVNTPDLLTEYVETYVEWSTAYGITDACMEELMAALRVESERPTLEPRVRSALTDLASAIEEERLSAMQQAA